MNNVDELFNQVLLVNTAKFYRHGLGTGYTFPEVNEWTDLVVGYIYFVKHNEEDLKWVIKENIDKFEDKYIVAFFVKTFLEEYYGMDETEARDVMIEFYNMPDEPLSEKEYQMTVSMIQQNPTYLKAFEKIWEEEED